MAQTAAFRFDLGDQIKDTISSFTGIVYGRTEWYNGCVRYTLVGEKLTKDSHPAEATFDEAQLVLVKAGKKKPPVIKTAAATKPTGGPFDTPSQVGTAR